MQISMGMVREGGWDGIKRKREEMMGIADSLLQLLRVTTTEWTNELGSLVEVVQEVGASLRQTSLADGEEEEDLAREFVEKGLLDLLPSLLQHSCLEVSIGSAEIVGALAVSSCEINSRMVKETEVLKALTEQLWRRGDAECCLAACHAIIDVAITPLGCSAVRDIPGLQQQLMSLVVCLVNILTGHVKTGCLPHSGVANMKPIAECFAEADKEECLVIGSEKDHPKTDIALAVSYAGAGELLDQLLVVANMVLLDNTELNFDASEVLLSLQKLWKMTLHLSSVQSRKPTIALETQLRSIDNWCTPENHHELAKLIVQLAMQQRVAPRDLEKVVTRHLFGGRGGIQLEHFLQAHWESSPVVMTMNVGPLELLGNGICMDSPAEFLKAVVYRMVACPPAFADEVDPRIQYEGLESRLGKPPVYDQDIRLVKSEPGTSPLEVQYFRDKRTTFVSADDCVSAYTDGYTVVIRGMQFRFPEIAALSDALAAQMGQVTVGANLYLTPPHSQGLVTHFDDHCVFVCQLVGHKQWKIYPPQQWLPRLYTFKSLSQDARKDPVTHYALCEGDVLYIPRGFPHEAHTSSTEKQLPDSSQNVGTECKRNGHEQNGSPPWASGNESGPTFSCTTSPSCTCSGTCFWSQVLNWTGVSLHLSLGVEVEPAFEWEGLLHIALRLWSYQRQQQSMYFTGDHRMEDLCEALLHVAIRNMGNKTMTFRKAWVPLPYKAKLELATPEYCSHGLLMEQRFICMLKEITKGADYHEAVKEYEGSLSWLSWLNQLSVGGLELNYHTTELRAGLVEEAFSQMADRFVLEAAFQASVQEQKNLLSVFRTCRRKLTNAMLALHTYH